MCFINTMHSKLVVYEKSKNWKKQLDISWWYDITIQIYHWYTWIKFFNWFFIDTVK